MSRIKIENLTDKHTIIGIKQDDVKIIAGMLKSLSVFVGNKLCDVLKPEEKEINNIFLNTLNAIEIMLGQCDGSCSSCVCDKCWAHPEDRGGHLFGDKTILDVPSKYIDDPDGYIESITEHK